MTWNIFRATIVLLLGILSCAAYAVQTMPPTTASYYVKSFASNTDLNNAMYNLGYQAGQRDLSLSGTQNSNILLDFGQPWSQTVIPQPTVYGVWSFSPNAHFVSTSVISLAVKWFAYGYWQGVGSDTYSYTRILVGTNNYGSSTSYIHGQAWAQMVNEIGQWFANNGYNQHTGVRGASDMEMSWSSASTGESWVNGYASSYSYMLYNYGDAGGCPSSGTTVTAGSCNGGWTQDNVWYVSWGASPSYPLPEIYATSGTNAKQWQQVSLYGYLARGGKMGILGPLSQSGACAQRGGCSGTNNTPDQAWTQLWNALNADLRTAQSLSYSTDIKWQ